MFYRILGVPLKIGAGKPYVAAHIEDRLLVIREEAAVSLVAPPVTTGDKKVDTKEEQPETAS